MLYLAMVVKPYMQAVLLVPTFVYYTNKPCTTETYSTTLFYTLWSARHAVVRSSSTEEKRREGNRQGIDRESTFGLLESRACVSQGRHSSGGGR